MVKAPCIRTLAIRVQHTVASGSRIPQPIHLVRSPVPRGLWQVRVKNKLPNRLVTFHIRSNVQITSLRLVDRDKKSDLFFYAMTRCS